MTTTSTRAATALSAGCGTTLVFFLAAATAAVTAAAALATGGLSLLPGAAAPSPQAMADIPSAMLTLYEQAAATCPGLPWPVLAGIGKTESDHGRAKNQVSPAGAVGPMQFLPSTFQEYDHPVPPGGADPTTPWDPTDAVFAAARLLCDNGARDGRNIPGAVFSYNHSHNYVTQVLDHAAQYAGTTMSTVPTAATGTAAERAVAYARTQLGVPYQWGAEDPGHAFDCSGLTQAAYAAAGITLPRTAQAQYDHGPVLPPGTPIRPGDLLFFGTTTHTVDHVGIAATPTDLIDAPHTGTDVRLEPIATTGHLAGITRPE